MSDNKLILYPKNPFAVIDNLEEFINQLHTIGLAGNEFKFFNEKLCFRQGTRFNDLIHFLENRSAIVLDDINGKPEEVATIDNKTTCFLQIRSFDENANVLGILNSYARAPVCRNCGLEINNWTDILGEWYEHGDKYKWVCQQCNTASKVYELDWKQGLAFAKYSIDIWNVHYQEAIPSEELLQLLHDMTEETWEFLYFRF